MSQTLLPGSIVAMTDQAADRLLQADSGDAALLYLRLLRTGTVKGLSWSAQRLDDALAQLRAMGLARGTPPRRSMLWRTSTRHWRAGTPSSPACVTRWSAAWAAS